MLPDGIYIPKLTLANFSNKAVHVTVRYATTRSRTSEIQPDDIAQTQGAVPQVTASPIATVSLAPHNTKEVLLSDLTGDAALQNSFIVNADGKPGDVAVKLVATADSVLPEVELLGKDLNDPENGGNHPWTVENGTRSTLLLFNNSDKSQFFNIEISTGTVVWRKAYQLATMQTQAISINDLIQTSAKDDKGQALPRTAYAGQIEWHTPAKNAGRGRLLESNRETAMARNFSCGYVAELCQVTFGGYTSFLIDGQTADYGQMDTEVCLNGCAGTPQGLGGSGYSYGWGIQNSSIANISGSSSNYYVTLHGAAPGTTYLSGWAADSYCELNIGEPPVPVLVPTSLTGTPGSITTYTNQTAYDCNGVSKGIRYGVSECYKYQINDQTGEALQDSLGVSENVALVDTNVGAASYTGNTTSNANGIFQDFLANLATAPLPANACTYNMQELSVSSAAVTPLQRNCIHMTATGITVTKISTPSACSTLHC